MGDPHYSHAIRWRNGLRARRFFSSGLQETLGPAKGGGPNPVAYPPQFLRWGSLEQSQFLEISIFLSQYLLSSQGDRMGMAHSVEGRFPFLDYRVVEFCNRLPSRLKLRGFKDKYLLRKLGSEWLPPQIHSRPKRPYRAPIHRSFFHKRTPDYVRELLSERQLEESGLFKPAAVKLLVEKVQKGVPIGETDDMALVGILSSQLVYNQFVSNRRRSAPLGANDDLKICRGASTVRSAVLA